MHQELLLDRVYRVDNGLKMAVNTNAIRNVSV